MSGITGIFQIDGSPVDSKLINDMNNCLNHRGPDGSRVWLEGPLGFGHQMLHTTIESLQEKLPYKDASGIVITADARIDNRAELAPILELKNRKNIPDSLFILKSYLKWGDKCPEYLLGDFAFAIWDENEERLFCARDHMGIKPFYYRQFDDLFIFASEIKTINNIIPSKPEINELAIAKVLASVHDDREITFFRNVYRLPGGHKLSIDNNGLKIEEYWNLDPALELLDKSEEEYTKIFYDVFSEAVRCRLRSAFPLGFTLSGGLDSSSVLCTANNILSGNERISIHTFSVIFDDVPEADESFYINTVLKDLDYHNHFIRGDNLSPLIQINQMFWHYETPHIPPHSFNWKLYENVQKSGVRILLTGLDGDTVLSVPYVYLTEMTRNLQFKKLHREISCLSKRFDEKNYADFLKGYVLSGLIPDVIKNIWKPKSIINKDFAKEHDINNYDNYNDNVWKKRKSLKNTHHYQITNGFIQKSLEDVNARSAAFSLDTRHPFYDKRMVELCYALPPEQKLKNGWDRIVMRKAMENILPSKVQWRRTKSDVSKSFIRNFLFFEKNTLNKIFSEDQSNLDKFVQIEELKKVYSKFKLQDELGGSDIVKIWITTTLSLWLKYIKEC